MLQHLCGVAYKSEGGKKRYPKTISLFITLEQCAVTRVYSCGNEGIQAAARKKTLINKRKYS